MVYHFRNIIAMVCCHCLEYSLKSENILTWRTSQAGELFVLLLLGWVCGFLSIAFGLYFQCIDQTRHMTVAEVRELLKQMTDKLSLNNKKLEAPPLTRPLLTISQGGGDLPGQLDHVYKHLLEYTRRDPQLSALVSNARMGKVSSAISAAIR